MSDLVYTHVDSPVGQLRLVATDAALLGIYYRDHRRAPALAGRALEPGDHPLLAAAASQLGEYFTGHRRDFALPLSAAAGTAFQRAVWAELLAIRYGERISYAELAARIGRPAAVRAVGTANGRNPLSIVVPCHRVVPRSGGEGGYAGGQEAKRWLLAHERRTDAMA